MGARQPLSRQAGTWDVMAIQTKRKISRLRLAAIAAIAAVAAAALGYLIWGLTLNPPRPADLTHADPEVIEHIDDSIFALRLVPFSAERWATLGMVYEANGMEGPAAECYEHSLQRSEDDRIWYRLAIVRKYHGDTDGALDAIDRALDLDPEYGPLHWRQGFWLLDDGQLDEAELAFKRATEHHEEPGWYGLALLLIQRGNAEDALELLGRSRFSHGPYVGYARYLRGTAYRMIGEAERARIELARGRGAKPRWNDPWSGEVGRHRRGLKARMDHASNLLHEQRRAEAIRVLAELVADFPDDMGIRNNLAVAFLENDRVNDAVRTLKEAVRLNSSYFQSHLNLASAYARRGDTPAALEHADMAILFNPTLSRAHETRGIILTTMKRIDDALIAFEEAVRLDARNANALVYAGAILLEMNRTDKALKRFEQAVDRDAGNSLAWIGLANAHISRGEFDEADHALDLVESIDPRHPELSRARRRIHRLRGRASTP